jgi:hypothetical protein
MKPGQDVHIRVLTVGPGQRPPPESFFADEIIKFVGSQVKRPDSQRCRRDATAGPVQAVPADPVGSRKAAAFIGT